MTVYIELIFSDNFLLDSLLLWLAARFVPPRSRRAILTGGAIGGIYAVLAAAFPVFALPLAKLLSGCLMVIVCFGRSAPKGALYFFAFSILLGGTVFALEICFGLTASQNRLLLIGCCILLFTVEAFKKSGFAPRNCITVEASFSTQTVVFSAEFDNGCIVKDARGNAVILIDRAFAERHFPPVSFEKNRIFTIATAAGKTECPAVKPHSLRITSRSRRYRADAWLVIADHIYLNGCPAVFGNGLKLGTEDFSCRIVSKSYFKNCLRFFKKINAIISEAVKRFPRRSPKRRNARF